MEDWTAAVAGGFAKPISDDAIAIHTGYLFGNATAIRTSDGLMLIDTGSRETASQTLATLRRWDDSPVHTVIYTHGHIDHTWVARLLDAEADARGLARPRIIAHRNVLQRFERYDTTHALNSLVMGRQFNQPGYTFPDNHRRPDQIYDVALSVAVGGLRIDLAHGRGETDDATFAWLTSVFWSVAISSSGCFPMRAIRARCSGSLLAGRPRSAACRRLRRWCWFPVMVRWCLARSAWRRC